MILEQLKEFENNCTYNNQKIFLQGQTSYYVDKINKNNKKQSKIICLSTKNPQQFISIFLATLVTKSSIVLINPQWKRKELEQVTELIKPDFFFSENIEKEYNNHQNHHQYQGIMIPTGGTSGKIKFAIHTWETLSNSAMGFRDFWQEEKINCFCCLPLCHVSGLMQIVRAFITRGKLHIHDYSILKKVVPLNINYQDFFISLVPTQLHFFLNNNSSWLKKFKTVLVGGCHTSQNLQNICRFKQINLALTYGMTETASGITILKPDDFFAHQKGSGRVLPHAKISIESEKERIGKITIRGTSLFKGYYPNYQDYDSFETDDLGYFDLDNYLHIVGRNSRKIISGGENVHPLEIEELIVKIGLAKDVVIIGKNHDYWGQIICAIYVPIVKNNELYNLDSMKDKLRSHLSHYKIPKIWLKVDKIPRNPQGKVNYGYLEKMITI
ncbi:AMP-binding protein [Cyanobacterium stanieri LEGE 03274]|uniref:AMP-binding protein n=1 Tax=Cyanobacterium stanieri LEGE 03274 TaxID=1828756 RepID=A0ABR9V2Q2_9CHRO|nr:AMP-binding protein [Cyanobacterium stanieri]MBE9222176.1 AMP-binding protein [Cyanobacterium stanieri LEGE 03274]